MSSQIDNLIAISIQHFHKLKPTLKPSENEWTTFSSIVSRKENKDLELICFALGTKSVAGKKAKLKNLIIDCHAESLCRRAFKHYLANKIKQGSSTEDLESAEYHLIISQLPCGLINRYKGSTDAALRKKPGRGELCNKPTCFDKIVKWSILGLQGRRLTSILRNPIRFKSIVIGNCSLELKEEDKNAFRDGFNLKIDSNLENCLSSFLNVNPSSSSHNEDDSLGPERKKSKNESDDTVKVKESLDVKPSSSSHNEDDSLDPERKKSKNESDDTVKVKESPDVKPSSSSHNEDDSLEPRRKKSKKESDDTVKDKESPNDDATSLELFNLIKPEIHFSDKLCEEMFTKKNHKKPEDRSLVYYLNFENKYTTEVIVDGRKFGTTLNNYLKISLELSPNWLEELVRRELTRRKIVLKKSESVQKYDLLWSELKKHPNFVRWS